MKSPFKEVEEQYPHLRREVERVRLSNLEEISSLRERMDSNKKQLCKLSRSPAVLSLVGVLKISTKEEHKELCKGYLADVIQLIAKRCEAQNLWARRLKKANKIDRLLNASYYKKMKDVPTPEECPHVRKRVIKVLNKRFGLE